MAEQIVVVMVDRLDPQYLDGEIYPVTATLLGSILEIREVFP